MRILHVTDCVGGGVPRAVVTIAKALPGHEHHVLWRAANGRDPAFASHTRLPSSPAGAVNRLGQLVRTLEPDIVHAHSSMAGVYSRVFSMGRPVVYQPHCYAFEDVNRGRLVRGLIRAVERLLAPRTACVVALTPHEVSLARGLSHRSSVHLVPNAPTIQATGTSPPDRAVMDARVVMVGRVGPQKAPEFFAEVVRETLRKGANVRFEWIGDGDPAKVAHLREAGVSVTGWLDDDELVEELRASSVYLHSGAYEGFPLSVLDAAAVGLPVVVRDIPAFRGTGLAVIENPIEAAAMVIRVVTDEAFADELRAASRALLEEMNSATQRSALERAYASAIEGPRA